MKNIYLIFAFTFFSSTIFSQHDWIRSNPGGGGAIATVGATSSGVVVAASDLSGMYKTYNNGASWEVIGATQGLLETHVSCFGFDPMNGNSIIIGTSIGAYKTTNLGDSVYPVSIEIDPNNGLGYVESIGMSMLDDGKGYMAHHEDWLPELSFLKTTDYGETWNLVVTTGLPFDARIIKILVDQNDSELIYALTGKARFGCSEPLLYKSNNGGQNWTQIALGMDPILDFDLHPSDPNIIFISTFEMNSGGCDVAIWQYVDDSGDVYKSIDGGTNFVSIFDKTGIISVGNNPDEITVVDIIHTSSAYPDAGTWKTLDGGSTWSHTGLFQNWFRGWSNENYGYSLSFNGINKTLVKDRFNPDHFYASFGAWAWSSLDGGQTVNNISTVDKGGDRWLSTGLENIVGNWIEINDGNSNTIYMGAYDLGFWYSLDKGLSWKRSLPDYTTFPDYVWWDAGGSNCNFVLSDPEDDAVVWASFSNAQPNTQSALFKSTEHGENWSFSNTGLDPFGFTMHGISLDVNSPVSNRTLFLTQNGNVFKSIDDGQTWMEVLNNGGLKFTAVDDFNSNLIYAGGENGFWRSLDGGVSWTEVGLPEMRYIANIPGEIMHNDIVPTYETPWVDPPLVAWQGVFEIKTDPNIQDRVYVVAYGTNKGLYKSDDAGITWEKLVTNDFMRGVAIAPQNSDVVYASSSVSYHSGGFESGSIGILRSMDAGVNWEFVNDGMAWTSGGRMEIDSESDPHIWAWSCGTGIQHALIPDFISETNCPGDANLDGMVNVLDLVSVSSNFGCSFECIGNGDANYDGVVNVLDMISVSSNFSILCD